MKTIKVDKVVLYYMDRVDPDGNLYQFYMYKGMASEIEYFCTKEAGNMTIPIGEGKYVKIVPKEIERIPVRGYRKLAGIWNLEKSTERWRIHPFVETTQSNGALQRQYKRCA